MGINPLAPQLSLHTGDCALSRKQSDKSLQVKGGRSQVFVVAVFRVSSRGPHSYGQYTGGGYPLAPAQMLCEFSSLASSCPVLWVE